MRVAFALIPEKGHVNPYIGPAQALMDLGHEVVIGAPGDIGEQMSRAGLAFRRDLIPPMGDGRVTRGAELVALIQDAVQLDGWIEQLLLGGVAEQVEELRGWYERERADVVVVDPLYYAAAIAAHRDGVPWVSVSNSLNPVIPAGLDSALLRTVRRLHERRAKVFGEYGMQAQFSGCDVLSPYLTVAFATEALVGPAPAGVRLAGPSLPLGDRGDDAPLRPLPANKPVLYASFGSQIYHWPNIFEKLLEAGGRVNAHMVFSMGELASGPRWRAPIEHCDVYRYAPQMRILRRAAAFVTHGGANSVMEAIACGVPLLLSPMCNDQFHQAHFVERAGIGIVDNLIDAPVDRIVEHFGALVGDARIASSMADVSATYTVNGALQTAQWIAQLGERR
jgi:zeaxanthin glucosyltransferase